MMHRAFGLTTLTLGLSALVYACSSANPDDPPGGVGGDSGAAGAGAGVGGSDTGGAAGSGGSSNGGNSGHAGSSNGGNAGHAGSSGGGSAGSGSLGGGPSTPSYPDAGFSYLPSDAGTEPCAAVTGQATLRKRPMDIIVSIDNSGSMAGEIQAVQQRINDDFAQIIADSGIDYRVIMVSRYGNVYSENTQLPYDGAFAVCIGDPLGGSDCPTSSGDSTPALVNDRARFFHHSTNIGSNNMWCQLTGSFNAAATSAPNGWQEWLRPGAFKVFIGITDDSPRTNADGNQGRCADGTSFTDNLTGAQNFDTALRDLSSSQFGTADNRNYAWYSIVGMAGNATTNPTPLQPTDPVQSLCCTGAGAAVTCPASVNTPDADGVRAGTGYQQLSIMTEGLRYPSCFNSNFDAMFNAVAQGVIERSSASCEYALPDPEGGTINPANIIATYHPSGVGQPDVDLSRISAADQCGSAQGFYLDDNENPTRLFLCPDACSVVQADDGARIDIDFGCLGS
jgi:hypothetical protein